MKCPVCDVDLLMAERQGVEIDYCPKCRGVWLDRGELDILIERSDALCYGSPPERGMSERGPHERRGERYPGEGHTGERYHQESYHGEKYRDEHHGHKGRKRKSFLEDLFDFGD
jgi:uncharacterized protein